MNPILLIEDEPGLVMTISDLLSAEGHRVESVSDGDAGLAKATQEKFALIILDSCFQKKQASKFAASSGKAALTPLS
jgi:DNA-binding response OmpR family regulator